MRIPVLLLLLLALGACTEAPPASPGPDDPAERDSVFALLQSVNTNTFEAAFERLAATPYRVTTRTEQLGADGEVVASRSRTYSVTPRAAELVAADSSGAFDYGAFDRFASETEALPAFAESPAAHVLPAEPAYLDPRGRAAFLFETAGDTLLGDRRVRILTVRARPGEGDDQPLRAARLYLDTAGALVGARVERRQGSMLFEEASTRALFLQPAPEGWLPHRLSVASHIGAPLAAPRRFRLAWSYAPADA